MIDFTKLPIGTRVFCTAFGWGNIDSIVGDKIGKDANYPVGVRFRQIAPIQRFTPNGQAILNGPVCLALREYSVPDECFETPLPDLPVDTPILVRLKFETKWKKRHFKEWYNGRPVVFCKGKTSWSSEDNSNGCVICEEWLLPENKE